MIRDTVDKIYTALLAETAAGQLLEYVKELKRGGMGSGNAGVRFIYPFVTIMELEQVTTGATIGRTGRDFHDVTVKINFGTQNMVPELAYYGDADHKGILHLADDLVYVCRGNTFNQAFTQPAEVPRVIFDYARVETGWLWMGELTLVGRKLQSRRQP